MARTQRERGSSGFRGDYRFSEPSNRKNPRSQPDEDGRRFRHLSGFAEHFEMQEADGFASSGGVPDRRSIDEHADAIGFAGEKEVRFAVRQRDAIEPPGLV